jgi:hypothetical protein
MSESTSYFKSIEFTWKIANYSQQKLKNGPGEWISSKDFPADCEGDLKFTLNFYPQGDVESDDTEVTNGEKWTSLYLLSESSEKYDTNHHLSEKWVDF